MYTARILPKIVLGHNPIFGIDHLSARRGQDRDALFSDPRKLQEIIKQAVELGAGGMMMSTHIRSRAVIDILKSDSRLNSNLKMYPLLPYAQKYITAANEKGLTSLIGEVASQTSMSEKLRLIWNGAKGLASRDVYSMLSNLIWIELKAFRDTQIDAVFLHDIATDLILALNLGDIVHFFYSEIEKMFSVKAAFCTKNLPLLLDRFAEWNIDDPIIMPHFNKLGFSMNPSRDACEKALRQHNCHVMAMSTLASGHLSPDEAYEYLGGQAGIESVVVGASTKSHLSETFRAIDRFIR